MQLSTACTTVVLHFKRSTIVVQAASAMETEGDDFVSAQHFVVLGAQLLQRAPSLSAVDDHRRFRALFGASPRVCFLLWSLLCGLCPPQGKPVHMLWALMFLKVYATEHVHAALAGVDEKTFRKWQWKFVKLLASLKLVCFIYLIFTICNTVIRI